MANERVLELMRSNPISDRGAAVALAARYQLVTPVTGAVVLETAQQYDESRLTPVMRATGASRSSGSSRTEARSCGVSFLPSSP